jgi:DNA-binding protein Fis
MVIENKPELNVTFLSRSKAFEKVYKGLEIYCYLFRKNIWSNKDLLDLWDGEFWTSPKPEIFRKPPSPYEKIKKQSPYDKLIEPLRILTEELERSEENGPQELDLFSLNEKEVLKYYHSGLLKKMNGNQARAAKAAGLKYGTYRDHCIKCGLTHITADIRKLKGLCD